MVCLQDVMADYLLRVQILPTVENTNNDKNHQDLSKSNGATQNTETLHINGDAASKHIKSY